MKTGMDDGNPAGLAVSLDLLSLEPCQGRTDWDFAATGMGSDLTIGLEAAADSPVSTPSSDSGTRSGQTNSSRPKIPVRSRPKLFCLFVMTARNARLTSLNISNKRSDA